jgi:hypothetical protein
MILIGTSLSLLEGLPQCYDWLVAKFGRPLQRVNAALPLPLIARAGKFVGWVTNPFNR